MCCGSAFWIRGIAFGLTFALGVSVTSVFYFRAASVEFCPARKNALAPENKPSTNFPPPETKNCVPADGSLKYERLGASEEKREPAQKKPAAAKKSSKNAKEKQTSAAEPQPRSYDPAKEPAEVQDLLHREKCFEAAERK